MTPAEAKRLSAQAWRRESDGAEYTGYGVAVMLRHWSIKVEDVLKTPVGSSFTDPMKQCPDYRRIR